MFPGPGWPSTASGTPSGLSAPTPNEINLAPTGIAHIRTRSSPSKLLAEFAEGGPNAKKHECNFADFSQDKLNVAQELLVARNPSGGGVPVGGGQGVGVAVSGPGTVGPGVPVAPGAVTKSGSFRRKRVSKNTTVANEAF